MPQRNLIAITLAIVLAMLCYQHAPKNRDAASLTYALNLIENNYVDEVETGKLFTGAMQGMAEQLDQYSGYTGPVESQRFQEHIDQKFGGIGVMVELNPKTKRITIMSPIVGTPAYEAKLMPGDTILAVDGKDTLDLSLRDCVELIHGVEGEPITLTIERAGEKKPLEFTMKRAIIKVPSVMGDLRQNDGTFRFRLSDEPGIVYLRVIQFGEDTAEEFENCLRREYAAGDLKGVIIDLRGNAGGLLSAALGMCDALLDGGKEIVSTRGRDGEKIRSYESNSGTVIPDNIPVVVMIDGFSASASEIVAACLQDQGRATVVGERSWGKGTVQNMIPLPGNRGTLRLTIASFWRPSGVNIHKRREAANADSDWGVKPDPGYDIKLSAGELERMLRARRQRDALLLAPGEEPPAADPATVAAANEPPKIPAANPADPPAEGAAAEGTAASDAELPTDLGRLPTADVDPQLRKAVGLILEKSR